MIHCKCGTKFRVKPEAAGKVVTTPCCKSRIRVPTNPIATNQPKAGRVRVQCSCGQAIALNRPKTAVQIQCPTCQKKLRLGAPAAKKMIRPVAKPIVEPVIVDEPVSDDFWDQPPLASPPVRRPSQKSRKSGTGSRRKKSKKKRRRNAKTRIPRIGFLKEEFGFVSLLIAGFVMLGILLALGTYLATQATANMAKAAASENWKSTDGQILQSGFKVRGIRRSRQAATVTVRYNYKVGDSSYVGNLLSFEKQDSFRPSTAEEILKPYPSGAKCKVYYDPTDPSKSVLIKGVRSGNTINFFVGLAMILGGFVLAIDCWIGAANARGS